MFEKYTLESNTLLGGIIVSDTYQELVHLSLKAGNEVPDYTSEYHITIIVLSGKAKIHIADEMTLVSAHELVRILPDTTHHIDIIEDTQILAIKTKI